MVLKRFSFIGDGLSHVAFGAMAIAAVLRFTNDMYLVLPITILAAILLLRVGKNTKIPHSTYAGDATIGENVEIACGVITANMNTKWEKNRTEIKDNSFIGCNSTLIAPVTIEKDAVIGAGSVITKNVPSKALAIERGNQIIKENYVK